MDLLLKRNQMFLPVVLGLTLVVLNVSSARADTLRHQDGTTIQGKIVYESPDQVRIETSYGTLKYQKEELVKIERDAPTGVPTPRINYAAVIPAGPVNPVSPPQVPPLVRFSSRNTTATAPMSAAPAAGVAGPIPTPVAPAVPPALPGVAPSATAPPPAPAAPASGR